MAVIARCCDRFFAAAAVSRFKFAVRRVAADNSPFWRLAICGGYVIGGRQCAASNSPFWMFVIYGSCVIGGWLRSHPIDVNLFLISQNPLFAKNSGFLIQSCCLLNAFEYEYLYALPYKYFYNTENFMWYCKRDTVQAHRIPTLHILRNRKNYQGKLKICYSATDVCW